MFEDITQTLQGKPRINLIAVFVIVSYTFCCGFYYLFAFRTSQVYTSLSGTLIMISIFTNNLINNRVIVAYMFCCRFYYSFVVAYMFCWEFYCLFFRTFQVYICQIETLIIIIVTNNLINNRDLSIHKSAYFKK